MHVNMAGTEMIGKVGHWLLLIGGLNLGLKGVGSFVGTNLDVINIVLGSVSVVENVVYLLIGLSALWVLKGQFMK